jgi:hypothetical protein
MHLPSCNGAARADHPSFPAKGSRRWIRNSTAIFAQRVRRRSTKNVAVVGIVSCLAITGSAAVHGAGAASSIQSNIVSMAHTHKGDRLPLTPKNIGTVPFARRDNTLAAADRM